MCPRKAGSSTSPTRSVGDERGLANCPAMRPTFTAGHAGSVGEDHRHLQDDLELVPDVVGRELGEGLGAVPGLQEKRLARGDLRPVTPSACAPHRQIPEGAEPPSSLSTRSSASASGHSGCCAAGRSRHRCGLHWAGLMGLQRKCSAPTLVTCASTVGAEGGRSPAPGASHRHLRRHVRPRPRRAPGGRDVGPGGARARACAPGRGQRAVAEGRHPRRDARPRTGS